MIASSPAVPWPAYPSLTEDQLRELLDALLEPLAAWLPGQRWFAHKGTGAPAVSLHGAAAHAVPGEPGALLVPTVLAVRPGDGADALYQVPLVLRPAPDPRHAAGFDPVSDPDPAPGSDPLPEALLGEISLPSTPGGGAAHATSPVGLLAIDAVRDPGGRLALAALLAPGAAATGPGLSLTAQPAVAGPPLPQGPTLRTRLLEGEQSNSSLVLEADGVDPVIVKLFRVLQDGENPDAELQGALTAAGCERVPALVGAALLETPGVRTQALLAQEFLPGVEDAWRIALRLAAGNSDVREAVAHLGATLAEVHTVLAEELGTTEATEQRVAETVARMRERLAESAAVLPQVQERRAGLEALYEAALSVAWPPMQRIHGDLHLGQVLLDPERGWVLVDFEGEPLRPLAQRRLPEAPLRDVAGMLRSLDYAAGSVARDQGVDATRWAADARTAFLAGYEAGAGISIDTTDLAVVLAAFEADKAVYEALYEARNRPDWLPIPLAAIARISAGTAAEASAD